MKEKKLVYLFLVLAISFTLFLPLLNLFFANNNAKTNLQSFSKQQLFSTDNLQALINYSAYKVFNFSLDEPKVIAGKDGFFFLGNSFGGVIDKTKGVSSYATKDIDLWTKKLKKLQDWYDEQGIQFIVVIASNKHTIYNDKLPHGIVYKEEETITDDIVKSSLHKNIHILNLKKVLRKEKQEKQLYFKTDTHWNHFGALVGYLETMAYLNAVYNEHYEIPQYLVEEIKSKGGGDLTNFLRMNYFLSNNDKKDYSVQFKKKSNICYGEITKGNNLLKKCTTGIKKTMNQYTINKSALNKEKVLYLCDSFGLANSSLYQKTFNTVWRFHISYTHGSFLPKFIHEHKPDIVIYQVVERDLGNNTIIDDIPK